MLANDAQICKTETIENFSVIPFMWYFVRVLCPYVYPLINSIFQSCVLCVCFIITIIIIIIFLLNHLFHLFLSYLFTNMEGKLSFNMKNSQNLSLMWYKISCFFYYIYFRFMLLFCYHNFILIIFCRKRVMRIGNLSFHFMINARHMKSHQNSKQYKTAKKKIELEKTTI